MQTPIKTNPVLLGKAELLHEYASGRKRLPFDFTYFDITISDVSIRLLQRTLLIARLLPVYGKIFDR